MNMIIKKQLAAGAAALVIGGFAATAARAASLTWEPTTNTVTVGETFDVNIYVDDLKQGEDLGSFDFNVLFDNSILGFSGYILYDGLGDIAAGEADDWSIGDLGGGEANFAEVSWLTDFSLQNDSFMLATLTFEGSSLGTTALDFNIDPYYQGLVDGDGIWMTIDSLGSADIAVNPVPEPATMMLFGTGLVSLIGVTRRKKK